MNPIDRAFGALSPSSDLLRDSLSGNPYVQKKFVGSVITLGEDATSNLSAVVRLFGEGPAFSALGMTTAFSTAQGAANLVKATHNYQSAALMHDENGQAMEGFHICARISQIFGGAAFGVVRVADITNTGFNVCRALAGPAKTLAIAGSALFGVLFLGIGALAAISIKETCGFLARAEKASKDMEELKALVGELTGEAPAPSTKKIISKQDLYVHLGQQVRSMINEIDPELAGSLTDRKLGKALFTRYSDFLPHVLNKMGIQKADNITLPGLRRNQEIVQKVWAKEKGVIHQRILGSKGMELVGKAQGMHLYELLSSKDPETRKYAEMTSKELMDGIQGSAKEERYVMVAYLVMGVFGVACTVLSNFIVSPLITLGLFVCYLAMSYGDWKGFQAYLESDGPNGKYAKEYVYFHLALGVLSIATAITLTVFTGGMFPIAAIAAVGVVWLLMDLYLIRQINLREKKYNSEHPTLQAFLDHLESLDLTKEEGLPEMFHKLPRIHREKILEELLKIDPTFAKGLKTFELKDSKEPLVALGEQLYEKDSFFTLNSSDSDYVRIPFAIKDTNELLISSESPLKLENVKTHPCRDLFYKTLYNLTARDEQLEVLKKGKDHLQTVVKKVMNPDLLDRKIMSVKTSKVGMVAGFKLQPS